MSSSITSEYGFDNIVLYAIWNFFVKVLIINLQKSVSLVGETANLFR